MSSNLTQPTSGFSWIVFLAKLVGGVLVLMGALEAQATIMAGDQFTAIFTEISPTAGVVATADFTLGAAAATPGFFTISSFSAIGSGGTCITCGLLSEDLTKVFFDSSNLDLSGDITGTFLGSGGNLHTFDMALTDPAATWTFTNVRVFDGRTDISSGTYATVVRTVDEPPTVLLFALAAAGLVGLRARAQPRRHAPLQSFEYEI